MDGKKKLEQQRPHIRRCRGQRIVAEELFFGIKDTYCIGKRLQ